MRFYLGVLGVEKGGCSRKKNSPSPRDWRSIGVHLLSFFRGGFSGSGKIADVFGRQKKSPSPRDWRSIIRVHLLVSFFRGGFSGSGKRETM